MFAVISNQINKLKLVKVSFASRFYKDLKQMVI